jgi:aminoglycoside 6'-N-acetyltransferase I
MTDNQIRLAVLADCEELARLRAALWPESPEEEHRAELRALLSGDHVSTLPVAIFVAHASDLALVGFLEVGLRSHADGCDTRQPVGFVEGWFVEENRRRKGLGSQLLAAAEGWARSQGCTEIASDTWIDHTLSQRVHEALKFEVVDRCVHYRKQL